MFLRAGMVQKEGIEFKAIRVKNSTFAELTIGTEASLSKKVTAEEMARFAELSGDHNPLHTDEAFARAAGFDTRVVYGQLLHAYVSALAGMQLPGKHCLLLSTDLNFKHPTFLNDTVTVTGKVASRIDSLQVIAVEVRITNQHGVVVAQGKYLAKVLK